MGIGRRMLAGALSGFGGTFVLTGVRQALAATGAVFTTAPEQVVGRLEELGLLEGFSPRARKALTLAAHFLYGTAIGAAFGALRRTDEEPESDTAAELQGNRDDRMTEVAVGATLGVLSWGASWAGLLPIVGVHPAPWTQKTPRAILPVLDHAVYGAAWGLVYWTLTRRRA